VSIACSADGNILYAGCNGYIYVSKDGGYNWTRCITGVVDWWDSIECSADGSRVIANCSIYVYISTDFGQNWEKCNYDEVKGGGDITISADGTKLFSTFSSGGALFISEDGGFSWSTELFPIGNRGMTCSDDGSIVAGADFDTVYIFRNNSGTWEWEQISDINCPGIIYDIECSSDGTILYIVGSGFVYKSIDGGTTWNPCPDALNYTYVTVTCSSDGSKVIIAEGGLYSSGYIHISPDGGQTWRECINAGYRNFTTMTVSSDGQYIYTVNYTNDGHIYKSTDFGYTWIESNGYPNVIDFCLSISCSADGSRLWAAENKTGYLRFSTNGGEQWKWSVSSGKKLWSSVTSSAAGDKVAACNYDGYIYTTDDYGENWIERISAGLRSWMYIDSSGNGEILLAAPYDGYLYSSLDNGETWTEHPEPGSREWAYCAVSSEGTTFAAVSYDGNIFVSRDYGLNWINPVKKGHKWYCIDVSYNGEQLAAADAGGYIYVSIDGGINWTAQTDADKQFWYVLAASDDFSTLAAGSVGNYNGIFVSKMED
jgi:photosystem II stability/assembly factor-like uncharacterized protein